MMDNRPKGCDISHNDNSFDLAKSAYDFIICKATQNMTFQDPTFNSHWQALKATNKVRGAYHFFGQATAQTQADNFLSRSINFNAPGCLPPILDIEDLVGINDADSLRLNRQVLSNKTAWIEAALLWLHIVEEKTGRVPMIYSYANYFAEYLNNDVRFTKYPLWLASYQDTEPHLPKGFTHYTIWQYNDSGLDKDLFNGTLEDLHKFANLI